jgi:hypothetical protein
MYLYPLRVNWPFPYRLGLVSLDMLIINQLYRTPVAIG